MNQAYKIHAIIQTAMGWFSEHLYEFKVHGTSYGDPSVLLENSLGKMGWINSKFLA